MSRLARIISDETGATAIEYGLIAALIAVGIMTALSGVGQQLNTSYSRTSSAIATVNA
jgi:pilus assembly protein Flp/PilA